MTNLNLIYMLLGVLITSISVLSYIVYQQQKKIKLLGQKTNNSNINSQSSKVDSAAEVGWPYATVTNPDFYNTIYDKKRKWINDRATHSLLAFTKEADIRTYEKVVLILYCRFVKVNQDGSMKLLVEDPYGEIWTETFKLNLPSDDSAGNFSGKMCEIHGRIHRKKLTIKRVIRLTYEKYVC
ncbi:MAG: hypothetical protein MJA82_14430 [Clostridia bacterium]|nr:hypothetical protein [Clostridia bacterium]